MPATTSRTTRREKGKQNFAISLSAQTNSASHVTLALLFVYFYFLKYFFSLIFFLSLCMPTLCQRLPEGEWVAHRTGYLIVDIGEIIVRQVKRTAPKIFHRIAQFSWAWKWKNKTKQWYKLKKKKREKFPSHGQHRNTICVSVCRCKLKSVFKISQLTRVESSCWEAQQQVGGPRDGRWYGCSKGALNNITNDLAPYWVHGRVGLEGKNTDGKRDNEFEKLYLSGASCEKYKWRWWKRQLVGSQQQQITLCR